MCQSSASIRHPRFLHFPLLEKVLSKKGKIGLIYVPEIQFEGSDRA